MHLYKVPSLSADSPLSNPVRALLHPIRALTGRNSVPSLSFDPLKPNQNILFSGVGGAGVPYVIQGLRQKYLEGRGAVFEFGFDGEGGDRLFKESLELASHRSAPVIVDASLSPLKYGSTILSAIQERACMYWQIPYGWDQNPLPGALIDVFQTLLRTQPSQQGRLLLILDDMGFANFEDLERAVTLAHKTGASVWVSTGSLTRDERKFSRLKELFDSFLIFRQDGPEGGELAIKLCASVTDNRIDVRTHLTPCEMATVNSGRFAWVDRNHLEIGQMPAPAPRA